MTRMIAIETAHRDRARRISIEQMAGRGLLDRRVVRPRHGPRIPVGENAVQLANDRRGGAAGACEADVIGYRASALVEFSAAIESGATDPSVRLMQADCLAAVGRSDEALAAYNSIAQKHPSLQLFYSRARLYHQRKQWQDVISDCDRALEFPGPPAQNPRDEILQLRGIAFAESGMWQEAIRDFEEAIHRNRSNPHHWYNYVVAHLGAGDLAGYRQSCEPTDPRRGAFSR